MYSLRGESGLSPEPAWPYPREMRGNSESGRCSGQNSLLFCGGKCEFIKLRFTSVLGLYFCTAFDLAEKGKKLIISPQFNISNLSCFCESHILTLHLPFWDCLQWLWKEVELSHPSKFSDQLQGKLGYVLISIFCNLFRAFLLFVFMTFCQSEATTKQCA